MTRAACIKPEYGDCAGGDELVWVAVRRGCAALPELRHTHERARGPEEACRREIAVSER